MPNEQTNPTQPPEAAPSDLSQAISDGYDPFEPGQGPGEEEASPPSPPEQATPPGGDETVPPSTRAAPPAQAPDPVVQSLAQIRELLQRGEEQRYAAQAPQQPAQASQGPRFNFQVPPAIAAGIITSEDPGERLQALTAFANGLANSIHAELTGEFNQRLEQFARAVPQATAQQMSQRDEQSRMWNEFYGRFPQLAKSPNVMRLVAMTAQQLAREQGQSAGWGPQFIEEVGKRVYGDLGLPAQQSNPAGTRNPKPASYAAGSGPRPSAPKSANSAIQDIWETMGY